jgi:hypothetical protein
MVWPGQLTGYNLRLFGAAPLTVYANSGDRLIRPQRRKARHSTQAGCDQYHHRPVAHGKIGAHCDRQLLPRREFFQHPEGRIVEAVAWFGLLLQVGGSRVFVARENPYPARASTSTAFIDRVAQESPATAPERGTRTLMHLRTRCQRW